ncbi:hypothetical protein GCM10018785_37580 [Streptomyces longispororuber]|uniref:Uncharacterized protein n=1 Tax=Streptomyces longispororuber TaxID=68230 RepID=A0A919DPL4_9ACTN|nr:hypothetical protein [Streptomyces longispororuber]GHE65216.1 hypothetical protein GCM10018785_37580 [Streptomyces longispororuber]
MKKSPAPLSPECRLGACGLCPGDDVPVYAPGLRPPGERPVFVIRCDYNCTHGCARGLRRALSGRS